MSTRRLASISHRDLTPLALETRDLPSGVVGRLTGVAMVYDERDAYGTLFAPGCLERTKREKIPAGKVQLFADHEGYMRSHVGVVRTMETHGREERFTADLFDTEPGRQTKEYLSAVLAAQGRTGASIGFFDRGGENVKDGGFRFTEVELEEISLTPRPAVPGAEITSIRQQPGTVNQSALDLLDALLNIVPVEHVRARLATRVESPPDGNAQDQDRDAAAHPPIPTPNPEDSRATEESPTLATLEDRRRALASIYGA